MYEDKIAERKESDIEICEFFLLVGTQFRYLCSWEEWSFLNAFFNSVYLPSNPCSNIMVCNTRLGSLPNEIRINKIGLEASKAALSCVKPLPGTLSS